MRVFIYCILIGVPYIVNASDQNTLPPLPTLDIPGSPISKSDSLPSSSSIKENGTDLSRNDNSQSKDSVKNDSTEIDTKNLIVESAAVKASSAESKEFIDTGNFVLPKIQTEDSEVNLTLPSIPSNSDDIVFPQKKDSGVDLDSLPPIGDNIPDPSIPEKSSNTETNTNINDPHPISGLPDSSNHNVSSNEANNISIQNQVSGDQNYIQNGSKNPSIASKSAGNFPTQSSDLEKTTNVTPDPVVLAPRTSRGGNGSDLSTYSNVVDRTSRGGDSHTKDKDPNEDRKSFISDESTMLLLEDDDIVLGKITTNAYLESLHGKEYINLFWKNYISGVEQKRSHITDSFIRKYEFAHKGIDATVLSNREAKKLAFEAIRRDNLEDLRVLVDNYPILQSYNKNGNNMLMTAIEFDNISISKFLLIRGVDLFLVNRDGDNILSIARESNDPDMERIINNAMFFGVVK